MGKGDNQMIELSEKAQAKIDVAKDRINNSGSNVNVSNPKSQTPKAKNTKATKAKNTFDFVFKSGGKSPVVKVGINKTAKTFEKYSTGQLGVKSIDFVPEMLHSFFNTLLPIAKSKDYPLVIGDSYGGQISINQKGFNSFKNLFGYQDGVLFVTKNQLFDFAKVPTETKMPHKVLDKSYVAFVATKENGQKLLEYAKTVL